MGWNSIGKVTVTTSGTPVQINPQAVNFVKARTMFVSTPGNTGLIYIGKKGMVIATGVKVLAVLQTGGVTLIGDEGAGMEFDTTDLYLDAATNGDSAIFSYFD